MKTNKPYIPKNLIRIVTASSLFDGHDASINIIRRLLGERGCEIIHLGHNRSVKEIVLSAIEEDAHAVCISSYQGGHMEYLKYMVDMFKELGCPDIKIFGGGGGVIQPDEIKELETYGVERLYHAEDGRMMGLSGIIDDTLKRIDFPITKRIKNPENFDLKKIKEIARMISFLENSDDNTAKKKIRSKLNQSKTTPVVGFTGTGGAGKSCLIDEIILRLIELTDLKIGVVCVDPTRRKTGGALLGDRIRMNSIYNDRVFMRSLATRGSANELSNVISDAILTIKASPCDLIFVETPGIGQGSAAITEISDVSVYVMTSEYGSSLQLEKIEMLDYADIVVLNKADKKNADDAYRDICKQYKRNHKVDPTTENEKLPVFKTIASQFNNPDVNILAERFIEILNAKCRKKITFNKDKVFTSTKIQEISLSEESYLADIVKKINEYKKGARDQARIARKLQSITDTIELAKNNKELEELKKTQEARLTKESKQLLANWDKLREDYSKDELVIKIRNKEIKNFLYYKTLSGTKLQRVKVPETEDWGARLEYLYLENVPGSFPYTAGVFPFKRLDEDPKRQFAGEGTPERTNKRFHFLSKNDKAKRLSTAFDSVTLYGEDPDARLDIYGKIGESGVSICTIDDIKKLFDGFPLCDPYTSVSMTVNGPAPIMLAMFLNNVINQVQEKEEKKIGRKLNNDEYQKNRKLVLQNVRGTVQADILKEDQAQNTCIFGIDFAMKLISDVQEYFVKEGVRNYYSLSISGYHIAEAGANPITQLAFTLANGFTYVEYFLKRGMKIDEFAPNLSFFFSNGMDPEYSVIGRVARRIWAIALKNKYNGNERSQKLKYHIQTSGRSLHAQEIAFNDIRTTLQALTSYYDHCNSLHTNSYDEAITTPTEESVRRAMAIQMIISKEFGLAKNENSAQGSYILEDLTELVEEAVLSEFERINKRGGVLAAMEFQYQRSKIQEESMLYEIKKDSGELPIIGVNFYVNPEAGDEYSKYSSMQLTRATKKERDAQIANLNKFKERNKDKSVKALAKLKEVALSGENIFAELMETVKYASLGQITNTLYEVGGRYRRAI